MNEPLQVYAAGSLREVLTEIAHDHEARTGQKIALTFGASGLLRERIEKGEGAQVFASADTQHPQRLAATSGWAPPAGQGTYAWVMDQGQADVFLTYCTNAATSQREVPRLKVVQVPSALQVGASYGLAVRRGAPAPAEAFARDLLAPPAQATFARYGFGQP